MSATQYISPPGKNLQEKLNYTRRLIGELEKGNRKASVQSNSDYFYVPEAQSTKCTK